MIGFFVPKKPINCKFVDIRLSITEIIKLNFSDLSIFIDFQMTVFENNLEMVPNLPSWASR